MKALKQGYRVSEIPSHEYERKWGTSKVVVWKLWFAYVWSFLRNSLRRSMTDPAFLSRPRALLALAVITGLGGAFRFYNLAWGAPYFHFHIDEHFVFVGAGSAARQHGEGGALAQVLHVRAAPDASAERHPGDSTRRSATRSS